MKISLFQSLYPWLTAVISLGGCQSRNFNAVVNESDSESVQSSSVQSEPPQFLFHCGRKSILESDVAAGTVPEPAWSDFIMGEKTSFLLPAFRRGLYGAAFASLSLYYGDARIGSGDGPWVMKVKIKDECRAEKSVLRADYMADNRFKSWILVNYSKGKFASADALKKTCLEKGAKGKIVFRAEKYLDYKPQTDGFLPCATIIQEFMTENKIQYAEDGVYGESWYVRDRACLEEIKGSTDDVLKMMQESKFWIKMPESSGYNSATVIAAQAFSSLTSSASKYGQEIMKALHDASAGIDKRFGSPEKNYQDVVLVAKAASSCAVRWPEFTARLKEFHQKSVLTQDPSLEPGEISDDSFISLFSDLSKICGIPLSRRDDSH